MFNYNPQVTADRIDASIAQLQQMKQQLPQAPAINQTFQLAPTGQSLLKYANSLDEVNKELVVGETAFFSKDMSVVWIKNINGAVRTYELNEIVPKDEKDIQIEYLKLQIEELKKEMNKNESNDTNVSESTKDEEPSDVSNDKSSNAE